MNNIPVPIFWISSPFLLLGTLPPDGGTTYYYGNNRFHARNPFEDRNVNDDHGLMQGKD